nr:hypothetical protein [Metamycoplasma alkalescens]
MSPYEILQNTKTFIEKKIEFERFLNDNRLNFTNQVNQENTKTYWEFVKHLGEYGNIGTTSKQRTKFYNPNIPLGYNLSQKYLEKFTEDEIKNLEIKNLNLNDLIKTNPFGFLPSNLSQLFHYVDFKSIERLLNLREITKLKARYDDYKGVFELLVFANNNKHYYAINKNQENNNSLKRNLDFYQYIYDRSFELNINLKQWFDNEDLNSKDRLKKILGFTSGSGTAWVIDRIKNNQDNDHYELLLATNMHVFNFRNTFDKSLHVHNKGSKKKIGILIK